ncbi:Hypothetical predicted protein [Mytilus galloprovincialis]|uniref:Uncharacterized protein n=1 Tax=Mytilus galloprovincialis TaxID=29158 RepID=A0A8B6HRN9_MYTGA|nr:Hypothetical predicted protein [Mytilus galloprovincialis]
MSAKNTTKQGNGGKLFSDMCTFIKDKCNDMKDDNMSGNETMEALNERFNKESDKLQDTEKTALNVMTLLMPVLDAFSARRDETLMVLDTKINRLQVGLRNIEYANDALDQQSRRDHIRVTGIPEVEGNEVIIDAQMALAQAMKVVLTGKIGDAYRTELCRSLELFFVNGRVGNDRDIGLTTCNNSVIDYAIVSPNLFRSIVDFNVLIFDPILSDIHKPICLHLCTNLTCVVDVDLNNSNVNDNDMDNTNDSNIVITLHGESESIVKPIWARDRAPVFTENLDDTSIDELLNKLEDIDPQNTDNVTVNNVVNDCVNIIRNTAEQANMFVKNNDKNVKKKM